MGRGGDASPWARETKEKLGMDTSVYQLNAMPPNSVHIHAEAKAGQACGLGNLSSSLLAAVAIADFELHSLEDLNKKSFYPH